jgi:hypothetical protein
MRFRRADDVLRRTAHPSHWHKKVPVLCTRTAKLIEKISSLVGFIVRTVNVETVRAKDFPAVLVARPVRERPMRA